MMKKKVWRVAAAFFVLMIVFTIVSRVAYQFGTVQVQVNLPKNKSLKHQIESSGQVVGGPEIALAIEGGLPVKSVLVAVGKKINPGDLLVEVDLKKLEEKIQDKEDEIKTLDLQIEAARQTQENLQKQESLAKDQAESNYHQAVEQGNRLVERAEQDWKQAEQEYQDYIRNPSAYPDESEEMLRQEAVMAKRAYEDAVSTRDSSIYQAQKQMESAGLTAGKDNTVEQTEIQRKRAEEDLQKLLNIQKNEGKVLAEIAGVVTEVNIKAGSETSGQGDILLSDASQGLKVTATFPEEEAEFLKSGQEIQIFGEQNREEKGQTYQITSVTKNEENKGMDVVVELPADKFQVGDIVSLNLKKEMGEFDICIPIEALHQGEKGKYYVYIIDEKNTTLGKEQIAVKKDVDVLEKSDGTVAVEGITSEQQVIVSSDRTFQDGSRVKIQE